MKLEKIFRLSLSPYSFYFDESVGFSICSQFIDSYLSSVISLSFKPSNIKVQLNTYRPHRFGWKKVDITNYKRNGYIIFNDTKYELLPEHLDLFSKLDKPYFWIRITTV